MPELQTISIVDETSFNTSSEQKAEVVNLEGKGHKDFTEARVHKAEVKQERSQEDKDQQGLIQHEAFKQHPIANDPKTHSNDPTNNSTPQNNPTVDQESQHISRPENSIPPPSPALQQRQENVLQQRAEKTHTSIPTLTR